MSKALTLLKSNKSVEERAGSYVVSLKRNIQKTVLDTLIEKKDRITDELFELTNFTLNTNLNQGLKQMTKDDCEKRFTKIIELEYELTLTEFELKIKQASFDNYFKDAPSEFSLV